MKDVKTSKNTYVVDCNIYILLDDGEDSNQNIITLKKSQYLSQDTKKKPRQYQTISM